ncbi:hypothetical protein EMN47_07265 [Prolixibacteraceae bacterium JC049]|nr:hypothetical protein [Prolixibacteraceae bacterium JC049]
MEQLTRQLRINLNKTNKRFYLKMAFTRLLWMLLIGICLFVILLLTEYVYYFPVDIKQVAVLFTLLLMGLFTVINIGFPLLKAFGVIKGLSNEKLNEIIIKKHPELKDYILNTLELDNISKKNELIEASIQQKMSLINNVNISESVDFSGFKQLYLRLLFITIGVIVVFLFDINGLSDATSRLKNYDVEYFPPAPYSVELLTSKLEVEKGTDLQVRFAVTGKKIPESLFIKIGANFFQADQKNDTLFNYLFKSVNSAFDFTVTDKKFESESYNVNVLKRPQIIHLKTTVIPPAYTGLKKRVQNDNGNVDIPVGSVLEWNVQSIDNDDLRLVINKDTIPVKSVDREFKVRRKIKEDSRYFFLLSNEHFKDVKDVDYQVKTIVDQFPEIELVQMRDSMQYTTFFFKGEVADDYGFSKLEFHVNWEDGDSVYQLPFDKRLTPQKFYFAHDFNGYKQYAQSLEYYFEIWDNDGINGAKKSISQVYQFHFPSQQDLFDRENEGHEKLEDLAQKSSKAIDNIRKGLQNIQQKSVDKNLSDWERSQMLENVVQQKEQLENFMQQMQQENEQMNNFSNSFEEQDQELMKKQQEINELIKEVFSDEIQKLLEEFNKLLNDFDQKKFNDLSQKMDKAMEDFQQRMDRNLEMLRKLQIERKIKRITDELDQMAFDEQKRSEEDLNLRKEGAEEMADMKSHEEHFESLMNELDKVNELNSKLENKMPLNFDKEKQQIRQNFQQLKKDINSKKRRNYKKNLSKNSDKLSELSSKLQQAVSKNKMQKLKVNLAALRLLLDDLVKMSFFQEDIYKQTERMSNSDPLAKGIKSNQKRLETHFEIMKDSIYALAKRSAQVHSAVNDDMVEIDYNLEKAMDEMEEGRFYSARINGRNIITSTNNIALMFDEIIKQLEQQMANSMPGDQQCENPSDKPSAMPNLKSAQDAFKQQLQNMINEMKTSGKSGKLNRQLGQALSQQEIMQNMIEKMMQGSEVGSEARQALKQVDQMLEQNKVDLMRYNLNNQLIRRQNAIFNKLLKAEKSEMEREVDKERKSNNVKDYRLSNPAEFFDPKGKNEEELFINNKSRINLKDFYKRKYIEYQKELKNKK